MEDGTVNINQRDVETKQASSVDDFQARVLQEIADKTVF